MDFLLHNGPSHYMDLFRTEHPFFSREGKGDVSEFVRTYEANAALTAGKGLICIPSGNHDMSRLAGMLDQEEMKIAFAFLLSMPGRPVPLLRGRDRDALDRRSPLQGGQPFLPGRVPDAHAVGR